MLLLSLLFIAAGANAKRIEAIAAVVGRQVITLSEVEFEARMILVRRGGERGLSTVIEGPLRQKVLDFMIVQTLLESEARRRGGVSVSESDVDKGVALFKSHFNSSILMGPQEAYALFLKDAFVDDEDVRTVIRRDLRVQSLLKNVLPKPEDVSTEQVRAVLKARGDGLQVSPAQRQKIRADLLQELQKKTFAELLDKLRLKVEIRVIEKYVENAPLADKSQEAQPAPQNVDSAD